LISRSGSGKALLAGENFPKLMNLFRERAHNAEFFDSYPLGATPELVWPRKANRSERLEL
jgi:hypothetical protein